MKPVIGDISFPWYNVTREHMKVLDWRQLMRRNKMTKHDRRQARAMKAGWQPGENFDWNSLIIGNEDSKNVKEDWRSDYEEYENGSARY